MARCMACMGVYQQGEVCPHCAKPFATAGNKPHQLPVGTILREKYTIGCALGQGGFGITYVGYDTVLDLKVAVKEFFPMRFAVRAPAGEQVHVTQDIHQKLYDDVKGTFLGEAKTLARLHDEPAVVTVRDYFEANGTAYIVMEYIDGETIGKILKEKPMSVDELLHIMRPLFRTLSRIHREGLIHRDISPDNIMLMNDRSIKLLDFGSARTMSIAGENSTTMHV